MDWGLFSDNSNKLDNSFFKHYLILSVEWKPSGKNSYEGFDRVSGEKVRSAPKSGFSFWFKFQLRSLAEVYAWTSA
ncbi:MAG: hypothetical protein CM15mP12_6560 [Gammaproteobacteria bacterium]|nr:MAG: hypothetical protein CM15mP12_6560 [Gammaproteobacteria bacterium]